MLTRSSEPIREHRARGFRSARSPWLRWVPAACLAMTLSVPTAARAANLSGGVTAPGTDLGAPLAVPGGTAPSADIGAPLVLPGGTPPTPTTGPAGSNTITLPAGGFFVHRTALVRGQLAGRRADGARVILELFDAAHGWTAVGSTTAKPSGDFVVAWRPAHLGRFLLRAAVAGHATADSLATDPTAQVEVYRPVTATYFGPGSYGTRTACGETLTPQLLGVAHRSLPCGTLVDILYGHQTITVPVIDRGPYVDGVSYDLTTATAQELGALDTVQIGAVAILGSR